MTTLLIVLAILYGVVTLAVAGYNAVDYAVYRESERETRDAEIRADSALQAHRAAQGFFRAPLWPLTALDALVRMRAVARRPEDEQ